MKETKEQQRERTDSKIMHATLEIIIAQGIGAVNIESVARRSGVAKTTIYRRYANTDDLIRHLRHRQQLELRILREVVGQRAVILPAKRWDLDQVLDIIAGH